MILALSLTMLLVLSLVVIKSKPKPELRGNKLVRWEKYHLTKIK